MTDAGFRTAVDGDVVVVRLPDPDEGRREGPRSGPTSTSATPRFDAGRRRLGAAADRPPRRPARVPLRRRRRPRARPDQPPTVDGAFGEHSWLALARLPPPAWLDAPKVERRVPRCVVTRRRTSTWSGAREPPGAEHLLLAHDGPEMAAFGGLLDFVGARRRRRHLPPMRVALLAPGPRNQRYAANPAYAATLSDQVVPGLLARAAPPSAYPVLIGQSLGGARRPARRVDHARHVRRAAAAVRVVLHPRARPAGVRLRVLGRGDRLRRRALLAATQAAPDAPAVAMTCGTAEENLANNRLMRDHLPQHRAGRRPGARPGRATPGPAGATCSTRT